MIFIISDLKPFHSFSPEFTTVLTTKFKVTDVTWIYRSKVIDGIVYYKHKQSNSNMNKDFFYIVKQKSKARVDWLGSLRVGLG